MRARHLLPLAVLSLLLAGCLPVELVVSHDGQVLIPRQEGYFLLDPAHAKVTRIYVPQDASPVFGRLTGDGKELLAADASSAGGGPGSSVNFDLVNLGTGGVTRLGAASNVTYLTLSPDNHTAAYTRVADQQHGSVKENLPELHLLDLASRRDTIVDVAPGAGVAAIHRWFPDSKSLLVFQIMAKVENSNFYKGVLARVDVATKKITPLAAALGPNSVFLDLAPDGRTALFVAAEAGPVGADLKVGGQQSKGENLYEYNLVTRQLRKVRDHVRYAMYSKTGRRVLIARPAQSGDLDLEVADAGLNKFNTIADDARASTGGGPMGNDASIYPGWIGDDQIAYLASQAVYGIAGRNLELVVISADGAHARSLQAAIDSAAEAK